MKIKNIKYILTAFILLILVACSNQVLDITFDETQNDSAGSSITEGGEIKLTIPVLTSQIADLFDTSTVRTETDSRAYLYAKDISIRLFDESGLVDTQSESIEGLVSYNSFSFENIPFGYGYYIEIDIINNDVSPTEPVVSGVSDPFSVSAGTNNVQIYLKPNNPAQMDLSVGTTTSLLSSIYDGSSITAGAEAWFEFSAADEITKLIATPAADSAVYMAVYDSEGHSIDEALSEGFDSDLTYGNDAILAIETPSDYSDIYYLGIISFAEDQTEHSVSISSGTVEPGNLTMVFNDNENTFNGKDVYFYIFENGYDDPEIDSVAEGSAQVVAGEAVAVMMEPATSNEWLGIGSWYYWVFIDVDGSGTFNSGDYSLSFNRYILMADDTEEELYSYSFSEAIFLADDAYEDDDSYSSAKPISSGDVQSRTLLENDHDWVTFNAVEGTTYVIETSQSGFAVTDTYLTLYNDSIGPIIDDDDGGESPFSQITWTADSSITVYAEVRGFSSSTSGEYNLSMNIQ